MIGNILTYSNTNSPKYGALKAAGTLTTTQKSHIVSDTLLCKWIRTKISIFGSVPNNLTGGWSGSSPVYDLNDSLGLGQIVVMGTYPSGSVEPFVTSAYLNDYSNVIADILDTYPKIKVIVIDNEEQTLSYHSGPMSDYVAMLQTAYSIAHPKGVKVTDGGILNGVALRIRVYQWLVTFYNQTQADNFGGNIGMSGHQIRYAQGIDTDSTLDGMVSDLDLLLSNKAYVDYWNLHYYEVPADGTVTTITTNGLRYEKEYLEVVGKRPVITNECGQRNNSQAALVTNMMNEFYRLKLSIVQWWDGTGDSGATPLTDDNTYPGVLFNNGIAFKNFITTHS